MKTCTSEKEKQPSGQWIARGDRVIAVRWWECVDPAQDREGLTFVDDNWTTPELLNSAAIVRFLVWDPKKKWPRPGAPFTSSNHAASSAMRSTRFAPPLPAVTRRNGRDIAESV